MADRRNWFLAQTVAEDEMDAADASLELADRNLAIDTALAAVTLSTSRGGIMGGGVVTHPGGVPPQADHTLSITAVTGYDEQGRRIKSSATLSVDCSRAGQTPVGAGGTPDGVDLTPAAGNERWVSLYVLFDRDTSDPRVDGTGTDVDFLESESFRFFVKAGAEVPAPAAASPDPALEANKLLLADIRISNTNTEEINTSRRMDWLVVGGAAFPNSFGTPRDAIDQLYTDLEAHVAGGAGRQNADTIDWAGGSDWLDTGGGGPTANPATDVEAQLDKIITDLVATAADRSGAHKIGNAAVAGAPFSLAADSVGDHISAIVSRYNNHIGGGADRHAADEVDYAGSGTFGDGVTSLPGSADLEATIDTLVSYLAVTGADPSGADLIGSRVSAAPGSPGTVDLAGLTAGSLFDQLVALKDAVNSRVRRIGDTMTGDLTPSTQSGTSLGSSSLQFAELFLRPDGVTSDALSVYSYGNTQRGWHARFFGMQSTTSPAGVIAAHGHYQARSLQWRDDFMYFNKAAFENFYNRIDDPGGTSIDVIDSEANSRGGIVRVSVGAVADTARFESPAVYDPAGTPFMHLAMRARVTDNGTYEVRLGFKREDDATATSRYVMFKRLNAGNWIGEVKNGGAGGQGVDWNQFGFAGTNDTDFHLMEAIIHDANNIEFKVDGVSSGLLNLTNGLPLNGGGGSYFHLFAFLDNQAASDNDLDVDWWEVYSDEY